ncbi:hypothetical protein B0H14DRAFT_2601594 [Mycena olivaceomarginata]|nr:hypothetical protein B0H14DRAFT_2601594 [Mycena olivaceomarginata]
MWEKCSDEDTDGKRKKEFVEVSEDSGIQDRGQDLGENEGFEISCPDRDKSQNCRHPGELVSVIGAIVALRIHSELLLNPNPTQEILYVCGNCDRPSYVLLSTLGPPGALEGFGDVVLSSRVCLPAASSEYEISRSQGTQGPIPGYRVQSPGCNGSVALAVMVQSKEQQVSTSPNIAAPTLHLSHHRARRVELETTLQRNIVEGTDQEVDVRSMGDKEVNNGPCTFNQT